MQANTIQKFDFKKLSYAYQNPVVSGELRQQFTDFRVVEELNHEAGGEGEHVYVWVEKCDQNTDWLASQLARYCGVKRMAVSYAGMKDRRAVTRQWFSIHLPGKDMPEWAGFDIEGTHVLEATRHHRKLRRGSVQANHFVITIRDLQGDVSELDARLQKIVSSGVPNYFGEQRFGHQTGNLGKALAMFAGKLRVKHSERSIYLSAARACIFNKMLSERLLDGTWSDVQAGDVLMLSGSNSVFTATEDALADLQQRFTKHDLHIAGSLAGKGPAMFTGAVATQVQTIYERYHELYQGLLKFGVELAYRPLRLVPLNLKWEIEPTVLKLEFTLSAGAYATVLIREIVNTEKNQ